MHFRKIVTFFILSLLLFNLSPIYGDDIDNFDQSIDIKDLEIQETSSNITEESIKLNSRSCVVLDRLSKTILFGKNEKNKVKMASTTKIMTAIIVLENGKLDETVNVSKKAANTGGSRLGLKTGDKITVHDLMYGLMLCSGNDAAVCLAESVAGDVSNFANLMNKKAEELGLNNTHFESPHGLDSDGHYTTAYELSLLADYALKNNTFFKIVGTKNYTVVINGYPKTLSNTNELLGNLSGVYGVKTGFTNGANRCLVTACKRNNMDIICVVLGADTKKFRTQDSIKLIEYVFKNFEYYNIKDLANNSLSDWKKSNPKFFLVEKGVSNNLDVIIEPSLDSNPVLPIKKSLIKYIEANIYVQSYLIAPIEKNTVIGNLTISSRRKYNCKI